MSDEQEGPTEGTYPEAKVILIVEDDEAIGEVLVEAISLETPYHAVRVAEGFAALKLIHGLKPNLMILDYQLPLMSGLELYDQLRTMHGFEDVPVLFMTANIGMPKRQLEKRKLVVLIKPLELDTLLKTIENLLVERSSDA
jgi:CheY-like chemotaxis protein